MLVLEETRAKMKPHLIRSEYVAASIRPHVGRCVAASVVSDSEPVDEHHQKHLSDDIVE